MYFQTYDIGDGLLQGEGGGRRVAEEEEGEEGEGGRGGERGRGRGERGEEGGGGERKGGGERGRGRGGEGSAEGRGGGEGGSVQEDEYRCVVNLLCTARWLLKECRIQISIASQDSIEWYGEFIRTASHNHLTIKCSECHLYYVRDL